jgi:hypothetical protein
MKRIFLLLAVIGITTLSSCDGDTGPAGPRSEVFELQNINFTLNQNNEYTVSQNLTPFINDSDNILIYRLAGTIDSQTPIWQLIPRTLFVDEGELDYDYDFSAVDFTIYAGGTFDIGTTPQFIQNQTFRIVIIPGYFSKGSNLDYNDYNAVIKALKINDSNVTVLK